MKAVWQAVVGLVLIASTVQAAANRTLIYQGPSQLQPIWLARGHITTLVLPNPITRMITSLKDNQVNHLIDGRRVILNTLSEGFKSYIVVETSANARYELQGWTTDLSKQSNRQHDHRVVLTDPNGLAEQVEASPTPASTLQQPQINDPRRELMLAMLTPHQALPAGVQVRVENKVIDETATYKISLLTVHQAGSFTGHTEQIDNLTDQPWPLRITQVTAPGLLALTASVMAPGQERYLPGDVIPPRGSARLYKLFALDGRTK